MHHRILLHNLALIPPFYPFLQQLLQHLDRLYREPRNMWRYRKIRHRLLPLLRQQRTPTQNSRLNIQHVRRRAGNPPIPQRIRERLLIHNATPRHINQNCMFLHTPQILLPNQSHRHLIPRTCNNKHRTLPKHLLKDRPPLARRRPFPLSDHNLPKSNAPRQRLNPLPEMSIPDNPQHLLLHTQRRPDGVPVLDQRPFLSPLVRRRGEVMHLHDPLPDREVQADAMLAHGWDVRLRRVDHGDATLRAVLFVEPADSRGHDGEALQGGGLLHVGGGDGDDGRDHNCRIFDPFGHLAGGGVVVFSVFVGKVEFGKLAVASVFELSLVENSICK
jgi:hypothetical protein